MTKEEKQKLEEAAKVARTAADAAHQKAADALGADDALNNAAEELEQKALDAQAESDAAVVEENPKDEHDDEEDIDFKKELEQIQPAPLQPETKSELERARTALFFTAKRVKDLGGDPTEVVKPAPQPVQREEHQQSYVTKDDLDERDLVSEIRKLARTEEEFQVILHHSKESIKKTGNPVKDAENAYLIAHKGKIKRSFDELRRAEFSRPPTAPAGPGHKRPADTKVVVPVLSPADQAIFRNRGFKPEADGTWTGRKHILRFDKVQGWVTEKRK